MSKRFDWFQFILNAFFGAIIGAVVGYAISCFVQFFADISEVYFMILGALIYSLVAGLKGDDFWDGLRR